MTSRLKEEERNERTIRNLLKLPENRRCINCNSLGPQYVCTNFWTFVCTTCSGVHREFTHRVKSISMAKFTSQEVSALQGGGNASAKEIYFKEWDPQRQSLPDSSNIERLRDFIKHVYVDRRYAAEKSFDKPPRVKIGEAKDSYKGGSRSPPFENERRYSERLSPGGRSDDRSSKNTYDERRSPGYDQDFQRSPPAARTDTVNDWQREDRFRDERRAVDEKFPVGDSKVEGKSPDRQKVPVMSSPPIVIRPVRDILGDKVSPLRVIEPPKADGRRQSDGSLSTQRTVSSSSLAASNRNPAEHRTESSLIDFDAVPEPPSTAQLPPIQQTASSPAPFIAQPTSSSNNNWANFDSVQEVKASHAPSNTNFLDVLSALSVPASTNVDIGASTSAPGGPFFPSSATPLTGPSGNAQASPFGATAPVSAPISHSTTTPGGAQAATLGPNAFAKKELPADLFTSNYSSFAAPGPGWFHAPHYPMGFNMQYNVPAPMPPAYLQPSRPSNPFDVHVSSSVQATTFPSMAPLQGALPNMLPPTGIHRTSSLGVLSPEWMPTQSSHPLPSSIQRTSSLGNPSPAWMPIQSSYPSSMSTQVSSYGSGIPSAQFMVQGAPNMPPPPRPQVGGFGLDNTSFGSFNLNEQQSGPTFPSARGNPFG